MIAHRFLRSFSSTHALNRVNVYSPKPPSKPQQFNTTETCSSFEAPTSNIPKYQEARDDDLYRYLWVRCRGHEIQVLDSYEKFLKQAAEHLEIDFVKTEIPWRVIKRKTMLASRFVKKKYRVQYEIRTNFRDLCFKNLTGSTLDTYLEYIERNLPDGVMLIAEKHRLAKLPFDLTSRSE